MKRIHLLLLLIYFWVARNTILLRRRDTSEFAAVDATAMLQIIVVFLLFTSFFTLFKKTSLRTSKDIIHSTALWFFLLYALGLVSALWSPLFSYSAYRASECLVLFFAIFVYLKSMADFEIVEKLFLHFNLIILLLAFFGHIKATGYSLSIATLHTNSYSLIALIIFLYTFGELMTKSEKTKNRKKMLKRYAWIGFIFIVLGTSAATNIAAVIGIALLGIFTNRNDFKLGLVALSLIVVPIFLLIGDISIIHEILFPGKSVESISRLNGRDYIWDLYIAKIYEKPYFGWGFSVTARIAKLATTNTHNSVLSILTGTGVAGGLLYLIFLIRSMISVFVNRWRNSIGAIGCGIALAGALVNSMSIAIIGEGASPASLSFVALIAFYFLNVNRRIQTRQIYSKTPS